MSSSPFHGDPARALLILPLVVTALIVSVAPGASLPVFAVSAGDLRVEPRILDFGDRGHGERPVLDLKLRNAGDRPLKILKIERSCGCLDWKPEAFAPLAPGDAAILRVSMGSGRAMGTLHKYLSITTDGSPRTIKVATNLRVFPEIARPEPSQFRFEADLGGAPVTQSVLVARRAGREPTTRARPLDLRIEKVAGRSPGKPIDRYFTSRVEDVASGKRLHLTLKPGLPEGRFMATLEARLEGKPFHVPVSGEVFRGIKASPTYFNFNRVEPARSDTLVETVKLSTVGDRPFRIDDIRVEMQRRAFEGMDIGVRSTRSEDGKEHVLQAVMSLPPPRAGVAFEGRFGGRVIVKTDHPEKPEIRLQFFGFFPGARR